MSSLFSSKKKPGTASTSKKPSKLFAGNKTWFVFAIITAVAAAGVIFFVLSQAVSTTTYYVLNQNVPARSQVTAAMLTPVVTSTGGQPRNALTSADVTNTPTFAKYSLNTGDIVTSSNTGDKTALRAGVPDTDVIASFQVEAQYAVAGKLKPGDYIDIIATSTQNGANGQAVAKTTLKHVLLLDVSTDPSSIGSSANPAVQPTGAAGANGAQTGGGASTDDQLRQGVPSLYTVSLPPVDATKLALINRSPLLVVLSSKESDTNFKEENTSSTLGQVFDQSPVKDSGANTDPSFGLNGATSKSNPSPSGSGSSSSSTPTSGSSSSQSSSGQQSSSQESSSGNG